jgi:hypothetical protein
MELGNNEPSIRQEIETIVSYVKASTSTATAERRYYLEQALQYYIALFDWQREFYFGPKESERMNTFELLQECVIDMEDSILQVVAGLWKPAFVSLRSCLEMGVVLVNLWSRHNPATYDDFFEGKLSTRSFTRKRLRPIFEVEPFQSYDRTYHLQERMKGIHSSLCGYSHTKGWEHFEGHLRKAASNSKLSLTISPLSAKEVWEKWLIQLRSVYQELSLLFALATPTFCHFLTNEQLPRSEKLRNILVMMNDQDVAQLAEFVKESNFV